MNPSAIEKAKKRLEASKQALERLRDAATLDEFEPTWSAFLLAHNSIFTVLEQGAKASVQSRQWFGGKKKYRAKDDMLNYLHQARNADEHDIPSVVEQRFAGGFTLPDSQPNGALITKITFKAAGSNKDIVVGDNPRGLKDMTALAPVFVLCPVYDNRFKQTFDPPTTHLEQPIEAPRAMQVAELAIAYTASLLNEAEALFL